MWPLRSGCSSSNINPELPDPPFALPSPSSGGHVERIMGLPRARGIHRESIEVGPDLTYLSAWELARLVRDNELSPVEIVESSLKRIERANAALNCFCFVYEEE